MTVRQQKTKIKALLRAHARTAQRKGRAIGTLTYGSVAMSLGYDPRAGVTLGKALGLVGNDCKKRGEPCINVLVVNASTTLPGHGVVLYAGRSIKSETRAVRAYRW